jgi:lysophospholipase L1-like esterase
VGLGGRFTHQFGTPRRRAAGERGRASVGPLLAVTALLAVAGLAAGIVVTLGHDKPPLNPTLISLPDDTSRYVALGDSYSAGEGVKPFEPGTESNSGDRCHRSTQAYVRRLQFDRADPVTVDFRACSGAKFPALYEKVQEHNRVAARIGLQAKGHLGADVGLVTLTMGGNDVGFAPVVWFCATKFSCQTKQYQSKPTLTAWATKTLDDLAVQLPAQYRRLRADAPKARIVVLGYPRLFSDRPSMRGVCLGYRAAFSDKERAALNDLELRLNRVIEAAALGAGLEFVDVSYVFNGHETCSAHGAWLQLVNVRHIGFQDGDFHPNATGQGMLARTVACYLTVHPSVPSEVEDAKDKPKAASKVPVPAASESPTDVQEPTSEQSNGDLGDDVYRCATGETNDDLSRQAPPVPSSQPYSTATTNGGR